MTRAGNDETCLRGLHPWTEENIYVNPTTGQRACRPCKLDRAKADDKHPKNSGHCRKGHPYTEANTRRTVRVRNGKKEIHRACKQCQKDALKTTAGR